MMNILNNSGQMIPEADWAERCVYLRVGCNARKCGADSKKTGLNFNIIDKLITIKIDKNE